MRRWLAARLLRGPDAEFIRHDLDEMYARDRNRGFSIVRAQARFLRRLAQSAISVWRRETPVFETTDESSPAARWSESVIEDFRFGLRLCRKQPLPVSIAIGGLALAIGVVVSVFTIVDNTMLKPFGIDEPSSVFTVNSSGHGFSDWRYSTFLRLRDEAGSIRLEASRDSKLRVGLTAGSDNASSRPALFVSGSYLQMLGGRPEYGRPLEPRDDQAGSPPVCVVSHLLWTTVFNADQSVVGKPVWINDTAVTMVGVLRPEFTGPSTNRPAMWLPLGAFDEVTGGAAFSPMSEATVQVVGRLAAGANADGVQEQLSTIATRAARDHAPAGKPAPRAQVQLFSAASPISGRDASGSYIGIASIFGIVGLVLAVACANTASLLFAATTTRMQEIGVRLSLGASTRRLVRQMLHESLLLAFLAAGLGAILSVWLGPAIAHVLDLSDFKALPDLRTLVFTVVVALVCGLAAGLSPARFGARGDLLAALRSQPPGRGRTPSRLRHSFMGFQAAVSILLLVAAALFTRTSIIASQTELGFDADRLLTISLGGSRSGFDEAGYVQAAASILRRVPTVERVSVTEHLPWGWSLHRVRFNDAGRSYQINVNESDAEFFGAAGVRVLRGREFTAVEAAEQAQLALVSESVARAFYRDVDPIGQSLSRLPADDFRTRPATIIGIVADAMLSPYDGEAYGSVYRPMRRLSGDPTTPTNPPGFVIRTAKPAGVVREIEQALRGLDPRLQPELALVSGQVDAYLGWKRTFAWLSVPTAIFVLLLSALGMFGVTAFVVSQRMQEMSIRLAMGASRTDLRRLLARDTLRPILAGLTAGLFAALLLTRYTARMFDLSGISPHDPLAIAVAVATLLAGALTAVLVPVGRAARANPATLFRHQ